jgi:hypothetical protein
MTHQPSAGFKGMRKTVQQLADEGRDLAGHVRRKVFVSYHVADDEQVRSFVSTFKDYFHFRCVGVTDAHDFVDSDSDEWIKRRIREDYLGDSTVTILIVGKCTWSRHFVDWEISSTLRNDPNNKRSGLVGIALPELNSVWKLPARARANWNKDDPEKSYLVAINYPKTAKALYDAVEKAFSKRDSLISPVDNTLPLNKVNQKCDG